MSTPLRSFMASSELCDSSPKAHRSSHREGRKVKQCHDKRSQTNSSQSRERSSNTNTIDTQAHRYQSSTPQKTLSTLSTTTTDVYTAKTPQWPALSERHACDYTLCGISTQFADIHYLQSSNEGTANQGTSPCPYHSRALEYPKPKQYLATHDSDTMSLYLGGNPSEQYALFYRSDTGMLSTEKGCVCVHLDIDGDKFSLLRLE